MDEVKGTSKATARVVTAVVVLVTGVVFLGLYSVRSLPTEAVTAPCEPCSVQLVSYNNPMMRRIKETGTGFDYLCLSQSHWDQYLDWAADASSITQTLLESYKELSQDRDPLRNDAPP